MANILLVEDNEMNRNMLQRRLARRGHEVQLATNGIEAIQLATSLRPDLIVMDVQMPVLDGWEATRRLKANPATRLIPVVALTAHVTTGDQARSMAAGCDEHETKPVDFERLMGKIQRLLSGPQEAM
jgi:CheY-like chemotaxis protein